jgi:pilus assembly protein CpaF
MTPSHPQDVPDSLPLPDGRNGESALGADSLSAEVDDRNSWAFGLKHRLHQHLLTAVGSIPADQLSEQELRLDVYRAAQAICQQNAWTLTLGEQETLAEQVLTDFLAPIDSLLKDHEISDIIINGPRQMFIEKHGRLETTDFAFRNENHLLLVIRRLMAASGRRLDATIPMADARLADGSRLNAVLKPPALNGPLVSIRRLGSRPLTIEDLLANESITKEMVDFLAACVRARISMIISGGTGSGKTTLMNALSRYIPNSERVVTIEEAAELELQQSHVAKLEATQAGQDGEGTAVTIRDLIRNALRMRPDRIIVGECRGAEALEMLQAMNTGHEGSLTSIHANSARDALTRIELMIGLAGLNLPIWAIRSLIASSVTLIVQVSRLPGGKRKIVTIAEIAGMEGETVSMHDLFEYVQTGVDESHVVEGYFRATGIRPQCFHKLVVRGAKLPVEMFADRRLQTVRNREANR